MTLFMYLTKVRVSVLLLIGAFLSATLTSNIWLNKGQEAWAANNNNKVTICHATGSATNPYVRTVVNANAISGHFENNGTPKSGHEDDLLFQGEVDCPAPTPT